MHRQITQSFQTCNTLKITYLKLIFCVAFALLCTSKVTAQDSTSTINHRFTRLAFEVRADFDVHHHYPYPDSLRATDYGFNGKYFNIAVGGEFGKHFSYFFRQRIVANKGSVTLFDNTDFLYLQYNINPQWGFRAGKEALAIGGFEYDAPPIDVFYYTQLWGTIHCFQLAASAIYTDKSGHNKLILQVGNSPYVYSTDSLMGRDWKKGLLAYSFMWCADYPHFKALYSVNLFERERGRFVNYISIGNRIVFNHFSWYIDYMNRAAVYSKYFSDFTVVSRMDIIFRDVNIFIKGGYDQNKSEDFGVENPKEIMVTPGMQYYFYGLGLEYRPAKYKNVRLHGYIANAQTILGPKGDKEVTNCLSASIGLTWDIDFLRILRKQFKLQL